jgi:hypothetical protein
LITSATAREYARSGDVRQRWQNLPQINLRISNGRFACGRYANLVIDSA